MAAPEDHPTEDLSDARDLNKDELIEIIRPVYDPDLGMSIVDLGLIYDARMEDGEVDVDMTLTTPGCPYGPQLIQEVHYILQNTAGVNDVNVKLTWDPPWSMEMVSDEVKLELGIDW